MLFCCLIPLLTRTVIIFLIFTLFPTPIILSRPPSKMFNLVWKVLFAALLRKAKEVSSWFYKARKWHQSTLLCLMWNMLKIANNEVEPLSEEAGSTLPPEYPHSVYWCIYMGEVENLWQDLFFAGCMTNIGLTTLKFLLYWQWLCPTCLKHVPVNWNVQLASQISEICSISLQSDDACKNWFSPSVEYAATLVGIWCFRSGYVT